METKGKVDLSDVAADNARDRVDRNMEEENKKRGQESMDKLLKDLRDPAYGHVLQDALKSLSGTKEGVNTIEDYLGDKFKEAKRKDSTMGDRTVNKLLDDFGKAGEFFIVLFCFALISFFCFLYYYIYIYKYILLVLLLLPRPFEKSLAPRSLAMGGGGSQGRTWKAWKPRRSRAWVRT